jgi:hypothetical protein
MRYARRETGEAGACFFPSACLPPLRLGVHSFMQYRLIHCFLGLQLGSCRKRCDGKRGSRMHLCTCTIPSLPCITYPSPPHHWYQAGCDVAKLKRGRGIQGPPVPSPYFPIRDRAADKGDGPPLAGSARPGPACSQRSGFRRAVSICDATGDGAETYGRWRRFGLKHHGLVEMLPVQLFFEFVALTGTSGGSPSPSQTCTSR